MADARLSRPLDGLNPAESLYPEGVALHSPGSRSSAPWDQRPKHTSTPKGLYNPFGVEVWGGAHSQGALRDPGLWSVTPSG